MNPIKFLSKAVMTRYAWFKLWYKQWFLHTQGLSRFAEMCIVWIIDKLVSLSKKLNLRIANAEQEIKALNEKLPDWRSYMILSSDWGEYSSRYRRYAIWLFIMIIAECILGYYGASAMIKGDGFWIRLARYFFAALVVIGGTYGFFLLFKNTILKPNYMQSEKPKANWAEIIVSLIICTLFSFAVYNFSILRAEALEGTMMGDGIKYALIFFTILIPVFIGMMYYEMSLFKSAYDNTVKVLKAEKQIDKHNLCIVKSKQELEDTFKNTVEDRWAFFQEFKVYVFEERMLFYPLDAAHFIRTKPLLWILLHKAPYYFISLR